MKVCMPSSVVQSNLGSRRLWAHEEEGRTVIRRWVCDTRLLSDGYIEDFCQVSR